MKTTHTHHIVPRYLGGTDDPENLVELTVEEHADAHNLLWALYKNEEDKIAELGLLGWITHEEAIRKTVMLGARKGGLAKGLCKDIISGIREDWENSPMTVKDIAEKWKVSMGSVYKQTTGINRLNYTHMGLGVKRPGSGRHKRLPEDTVDSLRNLWDNSTLSVKEIISKLSVSKRTVYKYCKGRERKHWIETRGRPEKSCP